MRGGIWVAFSSYWTIGFGFLSTLILTRILAPEAFGAFALGQFFASLLDLRPKVGIGPAFAQRKETNGELIGTHLALDVASALASFLLMLLAIPILQALGYEKSIVWIGLALAGANIANSLMGTAWILLDKNLLFGRVSLVNGLAFPLSYLPAFWLALKGGGYWSLVAQNATYAVLLVVGLWAAARHDLPQIWREKWRFRPIVARQFLRFGIMVGLATMAGMLLTQFDNFLVGTFVGLAALGFYDRAYRIAQWPSTLVGNVLTRIAFYTYAQLQDDAARLSKTVSMNFWLISLLALPLALAIFVAAPDLVALLYGERWLPSALFVRFLVVYSLLRPLMDIASSLFVAVGRPERATVLWTVQAVVLAAAATPLTLRYGALGTCIGVGIAFAVGLVLAYLEMRKIVAFSLRAEFGPSAAAAALAVVACLLLVRGVGLNLLPLAARVVVKAGFASIAFFIALLALQPRRTIERSRYVWRLARARRQPEA